MVLFFRLGIISTESATTETVTGSKLRLLILGGTRHKNDTGLIIRKEKAIVMEN